MSRAEGPGGDGRGGGSASPPAPRRGEGPLRLALIVHPRSGREELRWDGTSLHLWTAAPPVEGAANAACLRLVARWMGVPGSRVRLISGLRSRHKVVEVAPDPHPDAPSRSVASPGRIESKVPHYPPSTGLERPKGEGAT